MEKERLAYLDCAKGIGILLVVLGHLLLAGLANQLIYSFHMPLFFGISGYLIYINHVSISAKKVSKIFCGLLIPYFSFSGIYLLFYELLINKESLIGIIYMMYQTICFRGMAPLWFLASLFWAELFFLGVIKSSSKIIRFGIPLIIICLNFFLFSQINLDGMSGILSNPLVFIMRTSLCSIFIGGGYCFAGIHSKKIGKTRTWIFVSILSLLIISVMVLKFNLHINLHLYSISNQFAFLITGFLGIVSVIGISDFCSCSKLLKKLGENSLGIMAIHYPFTQIIKAQNVYTKLRGDQYLFVILMFIVIVTLSFCIAKILKRNVPFIFGIHPKICYFKEREYND